MAFEHALRRAFDLAYFIHRDRDIAHEIVVEAAGMLDVAASAQDKRLYYTPQGRSAHATAFRTKVTLNDLHLLQRLVLFVSERHERRIERDDPNRLTECDLLVRFVKHLVRITLKRSSFYVTLGMSRLLHAYSTPEAAELYSVLVQDPDRVRDEAYFRSRKKVLMQEMITRFGDMVHLRKGARGEERFEPRPGADVEFARICLDRFSLWDTKCSFPEHFEPMRDEIAAFTQKGADPENDHTVEVNRIHTMLHPRCFDRLAASLAFDTPSSRMEIPRFYFATTSGGDGNRTAPPSDEELAAIGAAVTARAQRRKSFQIGALSILVDGRECATFDPARAGNIRIDLDDCAEFVEVRSMDGLPLATVPLDRDADGSIRPARRSLTLEAGQRMDFTVEPAGADGARVGISYAETAAFRAIGLAMRRFASGMTGAEGRIRRFAGAAAAALVLVAATIGIHVVWNAPDGAPLPPAARTESADPLPEAPAPATEAPSDPAPDSEIAGVGSASPGRGGSASPGRGGSASPGRAGNRGMRGVVPDDARDPSAPVTRGEEAWFAARLRDVKVIYVDPLGDGDAARAVRAAIVRDLAATGRFVVTETRDEADAVMKGTAAPDGSAPDAIRLSVRLINADGETIWPTAGTWTVSAPAAEAASKTAGALTDEVRKANDPR